VLHDLGGHGPPILLLHGLMGAAATWEPVSEWLGRHGHVWALAAAGHRDDGSDTGPWTTERFVADAAAAVLGLDAGPVVVWGHSMGGLHAWCLAGAHPELVRGLVVEDMAPDFRGRTADGWLEWVRAWPVPFGDADAVRAFFGPVAGAYFLRSFVPGPDGWRLHGRAADWAAIAEHWGTRDHGDQWRAVRCPSLLLEAEHSVAPPGQLATMAARAGGPCTHLVVAGAGHLVHDDAADLVRGAVEAFVDGLPR
jgi:pimeloyl-ACP methyl ester carboxylesterase